MLEFIIFVLIYIVVAVLPNKIYTMLSNQSKYILSSFECTCTNGFTEKEPTIRLK